MILTYPELLAVLQDLYPASPPPSPLSLVPLVDRLDRNDAPVAELAREGRTTARRLTAIANAGDRVAALLGDHAGYTPEREDRARQTLGQLLIGGMAEHVFLERWRDALHDDLVLTDDRQARGDTDFIVQDPLGRQVFRLNIKFHGSYFRRAQELVGLDPEDTFALATYKIFSALQKQDAEHLPYIFVVVGVRGLAAGTVGEMIPDALVRLAVLTHDSPRATGKRTIEDRIVDVLLNNPDAFGVSTQLGVFLEQVHAAEWRVLSARRANALLRERLFERAYALRVRGFAQNYRGAELDMHFSVSQDLHPLTELFEVLRDRGMAGLASRLERGSL